MNPFRRTRAVRMTNRLMNPLMIWPLISSMNPRSAAGGKTRLNLIAVRLAKSAIFCPSNPRGGELSQ